MQVAGAMFSRWSQENFFKYLREQFNLDSLPTHDLTPLDPDAQVVNPVPRPRKDHQAGPQPLGSGRQSPRRSAEEHHQDTATRLEADAQALERLDALKRERADTPTQARGLAQSSLFRPVPGHVPHGQRPLLAGTARNRLLLSRPSGRMVRLSISSRRISSAMNMLRRRARAPPPTPAPASRPSAPPVRRAGSATGWGESLRSRCPASRRCGTRAGRAAPAKPPRTVRPAATG